MLNFICEAYYDQTGNLTVPRSLSMEREISDRYQLSELKAYGPKNRYKSGNSSTYLFLNHLRSSFDSLLMKEICQPG